MSDVSMLHGALLLLFVWACVLTIWLKHVDKEFLRHVGSSYPHGNDVDKKNLNSRYLGLRNDIELLARDAGKSFVDLPARRIIGQKEVPERGGGE